MAKSLHKMCIQSITVAMVLVTAAFILSHVLPPMSPNESAEHVSEYYRSHTTQLRIGAILGLVGAVFYGPFWAAVSWEIKRITRSEEAAYVNVILSVIATLCLFMPWSFFAAAAFRPERSPEVLHALYDLAWLPLYMFSPVFALQLAFLGWVILQDQRAKPTFPRWFAYYGAFAGVAQALGVLVVLEKEGPLAWNGVIAYWAPLVIFGAWTNLVVKYMKDGLKAEAEPNEPAFGDEVAVASRGA